jgi:hypothetical protein
LEENHVLLNELASLLLDKEKVESAEFESIYQTYAADPKPLPGGATVNVSLTPEETIITPEDGE